MSFLARVSISLLMIAASARAMKREVPASSEEQEAKISRVELSPRLQELPDDLLKLIMSYLVTARGATKHAQLYNAAESLRSLMMSNQLFVQKFLNNIDFNGELILALAKRYTNFNIVQAALALGTQAGGAWLRKEIERQQPEAQQESDDHALFEALTALANKDSGTLNFLLYNYPAMAQILSDASYNGKTPLSMAIENEDIDSIKALIEAKIDVNYPAPGPYPDNAGSSPLSIAIYVGSPEIARMLIEAGANVDLGGWTRSVNAQPDFLTPLMMAIRVNDQATFKRLLADPDIQIDFPIWGRSALFHAIDEVDPEKVLALLQAGANPNLIDLDPNINHKDRRTPLLYAIQTLNAEADLKLKTITELLLQHGADVNLTVNNEYTPLMAAADERPDLIPLLLGAGATVNVQNDRGHTPLTLAVEAGHADAVKLLLDAGADIMHTTLNGKSIFDYAEALDEGPNKSAIKKLLEERRAQLPPA